MPDPLARRPCPCDPARAYDACCGPLHRGAEPAATAERLMRSRYSAHVVGGRVGADHLFRTWHPRTRPDDTAPDPTVTWTGLEVLDVVDGAATDDEGVVEFRAHHEGGALHERSAFARRAGRWVYVDGVLEP
ncbi:YchJ family metal-binding protein [Nocardioides zeae]|uniref:YchJ family metal-binding protein n=1 Tax=Nocardioides imazamoxiresistens TaxID=3231893 RepID=A0ABU3PZX3_9ACTN|nr:YchJ family metal-binding protein [Nocardioides zeae]MDT9594342.1 YchJ family metal-binding protein [Nocardioides zeae]